MGISSISISISLSLLPLSSNLNPKTRSSLKTHNSSLLIRSPLPFSTPLSKKSTHFNNPPPQEISLKPSQRNWRICSVSGDEILASEANPVETSQQIVSTGDGGGYTTISVLLFIAFLGLSILTIGVIYIAVTDFLQKREREKFEKEEAAKKKKKSGKKGIRMRARAGPRGFGQMIEEEEDGDDDK